MFRLVAFEEISAALAADGTQNLANVAGLADSHVTVNGDNIAVPDDTINLMLAYLQGGSTDATGVCAQGRLQAPSLKPFVDLAAFMPHSGAIATHLPASPTPLNNYLGKGINLTPGENMQLTTAETAAGGDRAYLAGIFLGDGNYGLGQFAGMPMETVRFVGGAAAVAAAWTPSAITFDQALKAGTYAVVGMKLFATTNVFARLIFSNQGARPGCIGYVTPATTVGAIENPTFRNGNLGVWGTFSHNNPPQMELLCQAADAAAVQLGYLDVVKIG